MNRLPLSLLLAPCLALCQPTVFRTFVPQTADSMLGRLAQDSLGRRYVLQHNKILRFTPGQAGFQQFTYTASGPGSLTPQEIRVARDGIVYVAGIHEQALGPSQCDRLPQPSSFLGVNLHGDVATHWIMKLDLRANQPNATPVQSVCALARGIAPRTGSLELNDQGTRLYWYGTTDGDPSFSYTRSFGPATAARTAWIAELDENFNAFQTVRLGPVDRANALTVAAGRIALVGATSSTAFPAVGPLLATRTTAPAFVTVFNQDFSTLLLSTRVGGALADTLLDTQLDRTGNLYIGGQAISANLPVVQAHQPALGGATDLLLGRIAATLDRFDYLTYYGGPGSEQLARFSWNQSGGLYLTAFTTSTTPLVNQMSGALNDATISHVKADGRVDYFSRLPELLGVRFSMDVIPVSGGGLLTGYGVTGPDDQLVEFRDGSADLGLQVISTAQVGSSWETSVQVTNFGPGNAGSARFTAKQLSLLPNFYQSATTTLGACTVASRLVTCDLGTMAVHGQPNGTVQIRFRTSLSGPGSLQVTSGTLDPDSTNNQN